MQEGSPELAAVRAQALNLRNIALMGPVRTMGGTFAIGKGYSPNSNHAFLDEVAKRGGISRSEMMAITGNVDRRTSPELQGLIQALEYNKSRPKQAMDISGISLPPSYYQELIGKPEDLTPEKMAEVARADAQAAGTIVTMGPRSDPFDVTTGSMLPQLNPPSMIPSSAAPNNLVDADAESTISDYTTEGDSYNPDDVDPNYDYTSDYSNSDDPYAVDTSEDTSDTSTSEQDLSTLENQLGVSG